MQVLILSAFPNILNVSFNMAADPFKFFLLIDFGSVKPFCFHDKRKIDVSGKYLSPL